MAAISINPTILFRFAGPLRRRTCALSRACCEMHHPPRNTVGYRGGGCGSPTPCCCITKPHSSVSWCSSAISSATSLVHPALFSTATASSTTTTTTASNHHPLDNTNKHDNNDHDDDDGSIASLTNLSPAMQHRIRAMKSRHDELLHKLRDGGGDQTSLGKELSSLSGIAVLCERVSDVHAEKLSLLELLREIMTKSSESSGGEDRDDDEDSEEMSREIESELNRLERRLQALSRKMMQALVPLLDPDDVDELTSANAVIDIRAGTGGDEACLFASELMAAYEAIAKAGGGDDEHGLGGGKAWELEVLSVSRTDLGGVKEASLLVSSRGGGGGGGRGGYSDDDRDSIDSSDVNNSEHQDTTTQLLFQRLGPYGFFQYESGVHRVQRVPINDAKMQTSAVSVAVLPSIADSDVASVLPPSELKVDVMRASGAGGQHVNTTESAVRVTHVPTGIMAYMQEERSQHKNRTKALKLVAARVHQLRKEQALKDRSNARSSLMGGGDRSERIRTYNYSQDRITDHRCKVSVQGVPNWLGGGAMVRKFAPYLYEMERDERAAALEEEDGKHDKRIKANRGGK